MQHYQAPERFLQTSVAFNNFIGSVKHRYVHVREVCPNPVLGLLFQLHIDRCTQISSK